MTRRRCFPPGSPCTSSRAWTLHPLTFSLTLSSFCESRCSGGFPQCQAAAWKVVVRPLVYVRTCCSPLALGARCDYNFRFKLTWRALGRPSASSRLAWQRHCREPTSLQGTPGIPLPRGPLPSAPRGRPRSAPRGQTGGLGGPLRGDPVPPCGQPVWDHFLPPDVSLSFLEVSVCYLRRGLAGWWPAGGRG